MLLDDLLDLVGGEHRQHDRIAALRKIGNRRHRPPAELDKLRVFREVHIEAGDLEAGTEQTVRERLAQQADADETDGIVIRHCRHL